MKPTLRDYLTILIALIAIFLSGGGVGYLIGEKKGRSEARQIPAPETGETGDWEERTLARLTRHLSLDEDQQTAIEKEIKTTSGQIKASRDEAVGDYYRHLLDLHDRIIPHLDPEQQKLIEKDRKKLQLSLTERF